MSRVHAASDSSPTREGAGAGAEARAGGAAATADAASGADFAALYERHFVDVCRFLRAFGAPPGDLEDLAQEVFLVARRHFARFDGRSPSGWLFQIARRVAGDARRRAWWRHLFTRHDVPPPDELPHGGDDPAAALDEREARRLLHAVLARMTDKRRAVLVLADIEGYSTDEIAALEGVAAATVFSRLHYARRDFMALVEKHHRADDTKRRRDPKGGSP